MQKFALALAAVGFLATSAVAMAETNAEKREQITATVSTAGLDLSTPEGRDRLHDRLSRAIAVACNPGDRLNADMSPDWQCRKEMNASAMVQVLADRQMKAQRIASN